MLKAPFSNLKRGLFNGNNSWDKNIQILALKEVSILTNQLIHQKLFAWLVLLHIKQRRHQNLQRPQI